MTRDLWILNIMFLVILVFFVGLALWSGTEADRAHACLLDDACIERYRAKIELEKKREDNHTPAAHPTVINNRPYIFFY